MDCNRLPNFLMVIRQPRATLLTSGRLKFDGAWKQVVVLEMNMPVQIALKLSEPFEEAMVSCTSIFRCLEIAAQTTDLGQ